MRALRACALCALLWSCDAALTDSTAMVATDASVSPSPHHPSGSSPVVVPNADRDRDGLCDDTEQAVGTDAEAIDSDDDTWPDLIELALGFDPTDPTEPSSQQVTYLHGEPGQIALLEAMITVDGEGNSFVGRFRGRSSLYEGAPTSGALLTGQRALSANPPDNIRLIDPERERFLGVSGRTLLSFELEFTYPESEPEAGCAFAHIFDYTVSTTRRQMASPLYLLVITPEANLPEASDFCLPTVCE